MTIFRLSCALLLVAAAQQAPSQSTAPMAAPTFRAGARLVQVDVVVRDKKGPATGLTKEDFTLLDNGKPQEIAVFSVKSSFAKSPESSGRTAIPLPPGAVSNRLDRASEAPGTTTVLLLDRRNTQPTDAAYASQRIVKFLETRHHQDRFGIYMLGSSLQVIQDLTNDGNQLSQAVNSLKTAHVFRRDSDTTGMSEHAAAEYKQLDDDDRVMATKHALEAIARHLANVPGRKNLVWVTASFPLKPGIIDYTPDMQEAARALNDANVALYAVDARGLIGALGQMTGVPSAESSGVSAAQTTARTRTRMYGPVGPSGIDTMNLLASLTGGDRYFNTNGIEDSIQTAVEDAELTYTLGFYPRQELKDQDMHNLKVKVARSGVSVRYRENYSSSEKLAAVNDHPSMEQLLRDPLDATQVALFAETAPDQAHPGSYQVRVSVDLRDVKLERQDASWVGTLGVSFFVEGSKAAQTITEKIRIPADQLARSLEKPIVVETSIAPEGPNGILRIVAQDQATGAAGSLRVPLGRK